MQKYIYDTFNLEINTINICFIFLEARNLSAYMLILN